MTESYDKIDTVQRKIHLAQDNLIHKLDSVVDLRSTLLRKGLTEIERLSSLKYQYTTSQEELITAYDAQNVLDIVGVIFLVFGITGLFKTQDIQDEISKRQINDKEPYYPYCQSCGKKFSSTQPYGTKKDGSFNKAFCFECLELGDYKESDLTWEKVKESSSLPNAKRNWFTNRKILKRLKTSERWKEDKYV